MWFILALVTALFWGGSDLFSKMGTDPRDKYSHFRMMILVGAVMGLHAGALYLCAYRAYGPVSALQDWAAGWMGTPPLEEGFDFSTMLTYLPVSACYILSMAIGYVGLRYLELSVSSPVCNSSGALAAVLCFLFLHQTMEPLQFLAVALVVAGVVLLSVFDMKDENKARRFRGEVIERKYQVSLLAVCIPFFYCLIDALGTFGDEVMLSRYLSEEEAEIAYEFTWLLVAAAAFLYVVVVKKQKFRLWDEREKALGAVCETAGQFAYVYALADEEHAILAMPLISSYCLFSVIYSRVFLKEKLTRRQYIAIAIAISGIALLGVFDA